MLLLLLCILLYETESIKINRHASTLRQDRLLSLHSDPEDFIGATWIIFIDRAVSDLTVTQLQKYLLKDQCELLESAIGQQQVMFKIYCNTSDKIAAANRVEPSGDFLTNTLDQFLYKQVDKSAIHVEQNKLMRRPSHFYYGTSQILDYAIRYDEGLITPDGYGGGDGIKIPDKKTYDRIRELNFLENSAPWALDRIDQHTGSLDNTYQYIDKASDIDVYVIDSGIRVTHQEFQGRASFLINTVGDSINTDCVGHGTFVASEIGGLTYGVAKSVHLYGVKVLDCNGDGDLFTIQAGVMQVIETSKTNTSRRGVVNLSLGGSKSTLLDNAILTLVSNNLVVAVSAGNSGADACNYSPADLGGSSSANVITVSASDINDDRPSWANTGACVSISAPGSNVAGAWYTSDSATNVLSGTSMASPLVAGVAALLLEQDLTLTVPQIKTLILAWATPSIVDFTSSAGGGKNLLYSLIVASDPLPPTLPPHPTGSAPHGGGGSPPDLSFGSAAVVTIPFVSMSLVVSLVLLFSLM